jgi:hypothetical protein
MCTPEQGRTEVTDNLDDVANDDFDDECEFTNDEDNFVMMTPAVTMSQKIAAESATAKVSFTRLMLNMLGDRLRNVLKNCQFRSPFDSKERRPDIPLTKALALMKKIKKDTCCKSMGMSWYNITMTLFTTHYTFDYNITRNQRF